MKGLVSWLFMEYFTCVLGCTGSIWKEIADSSNGNLCYLQCMRDPASLRFACQFSEELCKALVCKKYCKDGKDEDVNMESFYYKTCNKGYTFVEDIGLLYRIVIPGKSHDLSMQACRKEGASLLLVNSEGIFNYTKALIMDAGGGPAVADSPTWGYLIDGKYENGKWIDGSNKEIAQYFWDPNMPQKPYEGTCMVVTYTSNGPWLANRSCNTEFAFICQIFI